jgi:hypothetical protein
MDQWWHLQREWGTVQPLKNSTEPTLLAHSQFMDKNKQLTLLSQCRLAFTGKNVLLALKIRRDIKTLSKPGSTIILAKIYPFMSSKAQSST